MIRLILFFVLTFFGFTAQPVSVFRTVSETTVVQTGMSNTALPASLVTCDSDLTLRVWTISATPTNATAAISVCSSSSTSGACTVDGDTSVSPIPVLSSTTIYIGQVLSGYSPAEITTGTKLDGDWIFHRYCVTKDAFR